MQCLRSQIFFALFFCRHSASAHACLGLVIDHLGCSLRSFSLLLLPSLTIWGPAGGERAACARPLTDSAMAE